MITSYYYYFLTSPRDLACVLAMPRETGLARNHYITADLSRLNYRKISGNEPWPGRGFIIFLKVDVTLSCVWDLWVGGLVWGCNVSYWAGLRLIDRSKPKPRQPTSTPLHRNGPWRPKWKGLPKRVGKEEEGERGRYTRKT